MFEEGFLNPHSRERNSRAAMTLARKALARGKIHCAFMTVPLRFHDTSQFPAAMSAFWPPPA
jgi:hypothetical protein